MDVSRTQNFLSILTAITYRNRHRGGGRPFSAKLGGFQLAGFFHQSFGSCQAFRLALRRERFGPLRGGFRSITPAFLRKGQHPWFGLFFFGAVDS